MKPCMSSQIGHQKSGTMDLFYWRIKMVPSIRNSIPRERQSPFLICVTRPGRSSGKKAANANLPFLLTRGGLPFFFSYTRFGRTFSTDSVTLYAEYVFSCIRPCEDTLSVSFGNNRKLDTERVRKGRISMVDPAGFEPASFAV